MRENIVEFPDRKAIAEEAAAWLIRLDGDRAPSADDLESLHQWVECSPVHRDQLRSLAEFWGKMNVLTELAVPLGHPDAGANRRRVGNWSHSISGFGRTGLVTATIVIGIAIGIGLYSGPGSGPDPVLSTNGLYATAVGQQQSTTLADGSVILLNTNSQVRVDYDDHYRNIRLFQGEAHFTVAEDRTHPFRVYAGNSRVQAVGTAFSVYLKDNEIDVTVTEGRVALASVKLPGSETLSQQSEPPANDGPSGAGAIVENGSVEPFGTLEAGESATFLSSPDAELAASISIIEPIETRELSNRLSWREGILTFTGDPLEDVVDEISRYTTITIEIADPAVRATRIGGRFPIGETDAMFNALEANFGLRVTRLSHDRVRLSVAEP